MTAADHPPLPPAHTDILALTNGTLYYRTLGDGPPLIFLHGGPDFDHTYLLPDMDRLADTFRLIYYDQRGRGQSAKNMRPEDVTLQSEIDDLEALRLSLLLDSINLLGHSWGALLALEYALQYPQHVSHLIALNTAPVSHADYLFLRESRRTNSPQDIALLKKLAAEAAYQDGDPDAVAAYYRVHFKAALRKPEHLEQVIESLRASFTQEGILKARAIEKRLYAETWFVEQYDLLPRLESLQVPTLVIHGEHDFVPVACARHVAEAIPTSHFVLLKDCGHFTYLECPMAFREALLNFMRLDRSI
jgi:proline iminopeptidase